MKRQATNPAVERHHRQHASSAAPPADLAAVAERVLARYEKRIAPIAVRLSVPVPRRFKLDVVDP
jgi:hypothetical protein